MSHEPKPSGHESTPSEEELRAQLEEELRRITVRDVLLQTVVSLVNLGGQRLGLAPGAEDMRDTDQARLAIEGVRALLPLVEEQDAEQVRPIRDALSQLQLAYAQLAGPADAQPGPPGAQPTEQPPPGPSGRSGRAAPAACGCRRAAAADRDHLSSPSGRASGSTDTLRRLLGGFGPFGSFAAARRMPLRADAATQKRHDGGRGN